MPKKPDTPSTLLRQWNMLRLVPRYPLRITTSEVVDRLKTEGFEVTKRTVERDLIGLSGAFPLDMDDRDRPYGWSWAKDAAPLDVPHLTNTQALAFFMVEEFLHTLLPGAASRELKPYFRMARQRLTAVAMNPKWIDKVRVIPPTQALMPPKVSPDVHSAITDALLMDRKLSIRYHRRGETQVREGKISPLGLVQRGALLYLVAVYEGFDDVRTIAMHRVTKAEILDESAMRPAGFNLEDRIKSGVMDFGSGKSFKLDALFEKEATIHLEESPLSADQQMKAAKDKRVRITATVADTPQLRWWLLGFDGRVEVLGPKALRGEMIEAGRNLYQRYRGKASGA